MEPTGVLIVGAGPTGLALALELARFDVPFRLIDRGTGPPAETRAIAVQPRTLEVLEPSRATDDLLAQGNKVRGFTLWSREEQLARVTFDGNGSAYEFLTVLSQEKTEAILRGRLAAFGGAPEYGIELGGFTATDGGYDATLKTRGATQTLRTRWIAGCDGAHSAVRHGLGIGFTGRTLDEAFAGADLRLDTSMPPNEASLRTSPHGIVGLFPFGGDAWRAILSGEPAKGALEPDIMQRMFADLHIPAEIRSITWTAQYHVNQRRATTYAIGGAFLLGDAAHIHSPAGGQGMNTGIQDAINLAWKLALVYHDGVPERLLDTYAEERLPVGRALLGWTDFANRALIQAPPWLASVRSVVLPFALGQPGVRKRAIRLVNQLALGYPKSPLSVGDGRVHGDLRPGARAVGPRPAGFRPQTMLMPAHAGGPALTAVIRPDGYVGYLAEGLHPGGAATYLENVVGMR